MTDELMLLWQQGASQDPDPEEVSKLAAKASMSRFDKRIFWRNFREYAGGGAVIAFFLWRISQGDPPWQNSIAVAAVSFVMIYIWRQHRGVPPLDPTADARKYQTAMLARLDHQIRLLRTVRYWYLGPLYIPPLLQFFQLGPRHWVINGIGLAIVTVLYWGLARLNERVAGTLLTTERNRIAELYKEEV